MRLLLGKWCGTKENEDGKERTRLYLNVYDLTPVNRYLYWLGLGVFHTGIQVYDMGYGFGAHKYSSSGVFEVVPRSCRGFIFRKSIPIGTTAMSRSQVRAFVENLASDYHGDTYHLIYKNCNHFTDDVCKRLTGKSLPAWVNRLARLAATSFISCLLPEQITALRLCPETYSEDGSESVTSSALADGEEVADGTEHNFLTKRPTPNIRRRFAYRKTCCTYIPETSSRFMVIAVNSLLFSPSIFL